MSPIKHLCLTYQAPSHGGFFSEGDIVTGTVSFTLTKETKVKSILLKAKGDARVKWSKSSGGVDTTFIGHRRYFKFKEYLVAESSKGTILPQGVHRIRFMLKIPQGCLPSSFKGSHGTIIYVLEAKISRSWRWPSEVQAELKVVSKSLAHHGQERYPCSGSVVKKIGGFSKGQVQMSATVNRKVCSPGDTLSVVAKICNSSSKMMRPKFSLQQKTVYCVNDATETSDKSLCKMVGDTIARNSEETVSCQLKVPVDASYTIKNCDLLSVEYYLKVYLDISFAFDPEVVLPLVVIPSSFVAPQPAEAAGPFPAGAAGGPSNSAFPPLDFPSGPTGSGAHGYPASDPMLH